MLYQTSFTFEGQSSDDFNIFIGHIGDPGTVTDALYTADIVESRIPSQIQPVFFGLDKNKAITREIILCSDEYLSREKIDEIVAWLTCSKPGYGTLTVDNDELSDYEFHVIFNQLELVNSGWPIAIQCSVIFDSQWAYLNTPTASFDVVNGKIITASDIELDTSVINNDSTYAGYIYPKITLQIPQGTTNFSITNISDDSRTLEFNFPGSFTTTDGSENMIIEIDCQTKIMKSNCSDINPYKCLPNKDGYFYFLRLLRGENVISFSGTGVCSVDYDTLKGVGL